MFERTPHDERANELLKIATEKKKAKDWDGAISALQEAYREIEKSNLGYSVETFLRLPQFLHAAGRPKEAWMAFNNMLFKGFPTEVIDDQFLPMSRCLIFDKMRLFLKREKKEELSEIFSIFSAMSWRIGLFRQKRLDELNSQSIDDDVADMISCLEKYNSPGLIKQLCDAVVSELRNHPQVDYHKMGRSMESVMASTKP